MRIPTILLSAAIAVSAPFALPATAHAQSAQDQFEVAFQSREAQRRATISRTMAFNDEEAATFWPVYDQYRLVAKSHQLRRLRMIQMLAQNTVGMDAQTASGIMSSALALEGEEQSAKQSYLAELAPHFSGARYFRLYQLETKLDAIFTFGWTKGIPLAVTEEERVILEQGLQAQQAAEAPALPTT